ncbi:Clavaminate synthase-like protein [Amylocystis lapponica]|nr:Clavaminate synthase-like protein [Amylocystis lapponica]
MADPALSSALAAKLSTLPIISIEPYLHPHDGKGRISAAAALHAACLQYGFFYLDISTYIDPDEPEELARLAREFFALPQEEKDKIALNNEDGARGYARLTENVTNGKPDNHEGIDFYRPVEDPDKTKPVWGENQWPSIPGFREKYEEWTAKMEKLGIIVMEAMANGLGMSSEEWAELKSQVDKSFWVMRAIGYPPLPNNYDGYSCGAHRDYGCLTFLWADATRGALQVFLKQRGLLVRDTNNPSEEHVEDGVWINADPQPGCIVCNIGEMWETWSNGLYKSTLHRVVHKGTNYRIPFFFEPNIDALVKPLPAALRITADSPHRKSEGVVNKVYEPVIYGDFLRKKVGSNFAAEKSKYDSD